MATIPKLEMSLDDIIKANKQKDAKSKIGQQRGGFGGGARKGPAVFKKRGVVGGTSQKGRQQFGRQRIGQQGKGKFGSPKRRVVGVMRRKPIGIGGGNRGHVGKKTIALRNNNRAAVMSAAENLVKKLVKKALVQNQTIIQGGGGIRGKFRRVMRPRTVATTNLVLNKISPRSRVIGRRPRIIANIQQQPLFVQRGRGPIRFASTSAPVMQMQTVAVTPRRQFQRPRRVNTVRYIQQQQPAAVVVQQQRPVAAVRPQPMQQQFVSVRDHITALRRANTLQQLQTHFLSQNQPQQQAAVIRRQQQPVQFVTAVRGPKRQPKQQQQFIVHQQQPSFQFQQPQQRFVRRRAQPRKQQQIFVQQQPQVQFRRQSPQKQQQQFVARQQFAAVGGRRPRPQQQQQHILLDPSYVPPNFLQRF